jgi:hypothetical protein
MRVLRAIGLGFLLVLGGTLPSPAQTERDFQKGYRSFQNSAPEFLQIEVLEVTTKPEKGLFGGSKTRVNATARVVDVIRSDSGLPNGEVINLQYDHAPKAGNSSETPPIVEMGKSYPAFLERKGKVFVPVARHLSFTPPSGIQMKIYEEARTRSREKALMATSPKSEPAPLPSFPTPDPLPEEKKPEPPVVTAAVVVAAPEPTPPAVTAEIVPPPAAPPVETRPEKPTPPSKKTAKVKAPKEKVSPTSRLMEPKAPGERAATTEKPSIEPITTVESEPLPVTSSQMTFETGPSLPVVQPMEPVQETMRPVEIEPASPKPTPPLPAAPEPAAATLQDLPSLTPVPTVETTPTPTSPVVARQEEPITITPVESPSAPAPEPAPAAPNPAPTPARSIENTAGRESYAEIYGQIKEGENAVLLGKTDQAKELFIQARKNLVKLKTDQPDFQPFMVEYRMRDVDKKLEALSTPPAEKAKP